MTPSPARTNAYNVGGTRPSTSRPRKNVRAKKYSAKRRTVLIAIADCRLVFDAPVDGVWASDHYGVCVDLAVRA